MKRILYVLLAFCLSLIVFLLPLNTSEISHRALCVTIFMLVMFITEPIHLAVTGLMGCWLFWIWAGIPAAKAFSGFTNDTPWFILGVLLIGQMATKTGLAKRMAYSLIQRLGSNYRKILFGMIIINFAMTFLVPSGVAKAFILCTIAIGLIESYGLGQDSNIGKGLVLSMTYLSSLFDKLIIAGAATILARGLIASLGKVQIFWSTWLVAFLPITILNIIACWYIVLKLFPPERLSLEGGADFCKAELKKMGRITPGEIRALVIMLLATLLWATDFIHHIHASVVGMGAGLIACLPLIGVLDKEDFGKINFPIVIFTGAAICMGNVMADTDILKMLTSYLFHWMIPSIQTSAAPTGLLLYWYGNLFHLFLANETSMISASMPALMNFALANGFNPQALGMIWAFSAEGKLFVYQSGVLTVGYAFGYFSAKDLLKFGLCLFGVESLFILIIIPLYWPLLGLTFN
jgi:sodium-dependent dicarboxylate transporter 2/3/5